MLTDLDILIIGAGVMLLMAVSVIAFVLMYQQKVLNFKNEKLKDEQEKQREIAQASIQSEEQERKRIAAELHDDVGANLSAVNLLLSSYLGKPNDILLVEEAKGLVKNSLQTIRGLSYKIHPSPLLNLGLQAAIHNYLNVLTKSEKIVIDYGREAPIPRFEESVELNAYRIIQEFVTNILKYAKPRQLSCNLQFEDSYLNILLEHDGKGMVQEEFDILLKNPKGLGLQNIKHRLEIHNGNCLMTQQNDRYKIQITIPAAQL